MESTKATPRVTRTRGKATLAEDTPAANTDAEMAPNLNGNKDGGVDTENATTVPVKEAEAAKESGRVTRKRKLTEVKTDEEVIKEAKESAVDNKADTKEDSTNNDEAVTPEESNNTNQAEEVPVAMDTIEPSKPAEVTMPVVEQPVVESMSNDFISISTGSETYGKGKRARVPNKRYSDIIRPITRTPKSEGASRGSRTHESPGAKNGEFPEDDLGEILREESEFEAKGGLSPVAKKGVKKTKPVSMSNPNYLKPFKYGWKRELVFRTTFTDGCRNRDVYYYNAAGKKFRSMREITDNLHNNRELSQENFTFCKETLGLDDTDKEIVRFAKQGNTTPLQINRKMTSKLIKPKKGSKADSPPAASPTKGKSAKSASFKVKAPVKPAIKKTKKEAEVEAPVWNFNKKKNKKPAEPVKTSKPSPRSQEGSVARSGPPNFMNTYMQNLQYGYTTLFGVFQYLKVQDLLRAGCVCTMWRDMSRYPALWRTVRMKNSQIHSFDGMANALRQHGTVHLDLRKMLLPSNATDDDIWPSFTNAIKKVESLRRIELCRCLASVVEDLARNNHNLEVINAVTIKCEGMTFEPFENLTNLVDLRLKSMAGLTLSSDLSALQALTKLKHLSITSIKDLNKLNIEVIADLVNLEVLDLGECTDFPKHFGTDILSKLTKLEKLRLEKGQGDCHTFEILEAVKELPGLQQLELVNFDIKAGFDKTLGACFNIKKLLIIPTYISQSATTNHMVLGGVLRLQKTLSHFVWGVTLELLRVTQLFVSQQSSEQPDKKESNETNSESIPVLKPVPLHGIPQAEAASPSDTPQVEILPLSNLKNLLLQNLPTTRVKIVKIPFHSTWRQSITDSVN